MPNFTIISSYNDILVFNNEQWKTSLKFNCKDRIVDKAGKVPSLDYKGNQYEIIFKRQRDFSHLERFGRGFLGTLTVASSLGIALLSKSVLKLFTKQKQSIRFGIPLLPLDNLPKPKDCKEEYNISKEELQQGISISQKRVQYLLKRREDANTTFYGAGINNYLVFGLDAEPELIFKLAFFPDDDSFLNDRYEKTIFAKTVIRTHQLGLLIIPNTKLFTVTLRKRKHAVIVEQKMDIDQDIDVQEQSFLDYADSLNEAVCQLALFICKTGYSDVAWRNNPILNNSLDEKGNRKIVLVDLEELDSPEVGLFGEENKRRGLVGCVNEKQGKMVKIIAEKEGISTSLFTYAYFRRRMELEEEYGLKKLHTKKRITV